MYVSVIDPANPTTSAITGIYNMPQSSPAPAGYIGQIADDDSRIAVFNAPSVAQQVQAAIAQGIVITSTSTPLLNGTYAIDPAMQGNINAVITYILVNGNFPGNSATMPWYDITGGPHLFPSIDVFKTFASAIANIVAALAIFGAGGLPSIPSNQVTIA